jgi:hypothetical protein
LTVLEAWGHSHTSRPGMPAMMFAMNEF